MKIKHYLIFIALVTNIIFASISHAGEYDKFLTLIFGTGTSTWLGEEDPSEALYDGVVSINIPAFSFGKGDSNKIYFSHRSFYESINDLVVLPEGFLDYTANQNHSLSIDFLRFMPKSSINIHLSALLDTYLNNDSSAWADGLFNNSRVEASINIEKATRGAVIYEEKTISEEIEFINPETENTETFKYDYTLNKGRLIPEKIKYGFSYNYHDYHNPVDISEYFDMNFIEKKDYNFHQFKLYIGRYRIYSPVISDSNMYKWQKKKSGAAKKKYNALLKKIEKLRREKEEANGNKKPGIESRIKKHEEEIRILQEEYMIDYNSKTNKMLIRTETTKYALSYYYSLEYLAFPWQNILAESGEPGDAARNDIRNTAKLNASYFFIPGKAKLFLEGNALWNISGQNYYSPSTLAFIPDYYEYFKYGITTGIRTSSTRPMIPRISAGFSYQFTDYLKRYLPDDYPYYFFTTFNIRNYLLSLIIEIPINDNIFARFTGTHESYIAEIGDRRKYEDGFKEALSFNSEIGLINYYFHVGLRF